MAYPSEGTEGANRNPYKEVLRYTICKFRFETIISNKSTRRCSERTYDHAKFHERVAIFPFDENSVPPLDLINHFCVDVDAWLKSDPQNVIVVHCKEGKARTGVMICSYLLFTGEWETAEEALAFFEISRAVNKQCVSIPSQIRYVQYFSQYVKSGFSMNRAMVMLKKIVLSPRPKLPKNTGIVREEGNHKTNGKKGKWHKDKRSPETASASSATPPTTTSTIVSGGSSTTATGSGGAVTTTVGSAGGSAGASNSTANKKLDKGREKPKKFSDNPEEDLDASVVQHTFFDKILQLMSDNPYENANIFSLLLSFQNYCKESEASSWGSDFHELNIPNVPLCGDINIEIITASPSSNEVLFNFWFNTSFIRDGKLSVFKSGLDKSSQDNRLAPTFRVDLLADTVTPTPYMHSHAQPLPHHPPIATPSVPTVVSHSQHEQQHTSSALASSSAAGTYGSAGASGSSATSSVMDQPIVLPPLFDGMEGDSRHWHNSTVAQELTRIAAANAIHSQFFPSDVLDRALTVVGSKFPCSGIVNSDPRFYGVARDPEKLSIYLLESILKIYLRCGYWGICLDENIVAVSYHSDFSQFLVALSELQSVQLERLVTLEQKLAFWLNIYNIMALHSVAVTTLLPTSEPISVKLREKASLMQQFLYTIGGHTFSHWDVEYSLLRSDMPLPENGIALNPSKFEESDPRSRFTVETRDPRIPFAITMCTVSSPGVCIFHSASLNEQLNQAMRSYSAQNIHFISNLKQVYLPRQVQWFSRDFSNKIAQFEFFEQYLPEGFSGKKKPLKKKKKSILLKYDVRYNEYDWELRLLCTHLSRIMDTTHRGRSPVFLPPTTAMRLYPRAPTLPAYPTPETGNLRLPSVSSSFYETDDMDTHHHHHHHRHNKHGIPVTTTSSTTRQHAYNQEESALASNDNKFVIISKIHPSAADRGEVDSAHIESKKDDSRENADQEHQTVHPKNVHKQVASTSPQVTPPAPTATTTTTTTTLVVVPATTTPPISAVTVPIFNKGSSPPTPSAVAALGSASSISATGLGVNISVGASAGSVDGDYEGRSEEPHLGHACPGSQLSCFVEGSMAATTSTYSLPTLSTATSPPCGKSVINEEELSSDF
ncbi:protein tyrosine phosphatase [Pelomyxa schiedti]|nr:protein tyrosine phosphatase [Pelomyxa schiedti]